ncbi:phage major capsid protein [Ruminococcaceae bacterium OttesenSCG-928-I18]|nr:phage major capsid protein [Ruminococcaceae bacterium OttesenSCG-928-I18]
MNATMKDLLVKMRAKHKEADAAHVAGDKDKTAALLVEFNTLKEEYDVAEQLFQAEKALVPDFKEAEAKAKAGFEGQTENGYTLIGKILRGKQLSDKEAALIVDGTDGENYLIPEDVRLDIIELRKQYKSAKDLVTVIPTASMTGGFNFEAGGITGLQEFDDGDDIPVSDQPKFERKPFRIALKGKLIPVSNVLQQVEKAGLLAYINAWFVKNAMFSENKDIFDTLKDGLTAKSIKGLDQLRKAMNKDLDPSAKVGAKIVTNQTGFDLMDEEKDENGRGLLQPDPVNPTVLKFKGYPIEVFSDSELPNITSTTKAPLFFGAIDAADYFIDLMGLQFASSEHFLFGKNQTALRVIEGYDNLQADIGAIFYAGFEAKPVTTP